MRSQVDDGQVGQGRRGSFGNAQLSPGNYYSTSLDPLQKEKFSPQLRDRAQFTHSSRKGATRAQGGEADSAGLRNDPSGGEVKFAIQNSKIRELTEFLFTPGYAVNELPELHGEEVKVWKNAEKEPTYLFITNFRKPLTKEQAETIKGLEDEGMERLELRCYTLWDMHTPARFGVFPVFNGRLRYTKPIAVVRGWEPGDFVSQDPKRGTPPWIWLGDDDFPKRGEVKILQK